MLPAPPQSYLQRNIANKTDKGMQTPNTFQIPADCFVVHGSVKMAALAECYALRDGTAPEFTVSDFILSHQQQPAPGDRVAAGPAEFVVMQAEGGQVLTAGLRFPAVAQPHTGLSSRHRRLNSGQASRHFLAPYRWPSRSDHGDHGDHAQLSPG